MISAVRNPFLRIKIKCFYPWWLETQTSFDELDLSLSHTTSVNEFIDVIKKHKHFNNLTLNMYVIFIYDRDSILQTVNIFIFTKLWTFCLSNLYCNVCFLGSVIHLYCNITTKLYVKKKTVLFFVKQSVFLVQILWNLWSNVAAEFPTINTQCYLAISCFFFLWLYKLCKFMQITLGKRTFISCILQILFLNA